MKETRKSKENLQECRKISSILACRRDWWVRESEPEIDLIGANPLLIILKCYKISSFREKIFEKGFYDTKEKDRDKETLFALRFQVFDMSLQLAVKTKLTLYSKAAFYG